MCFLNREDKTCIRFLLQHQATCVCLRCLSELQIQMLSWRCQCIVVKYYRALQDFCWPCFDVLPMYFLPYLVVSHTYWSKELHEESFSKPPPSLYIQVSCPYQWIRLSHYSIANPRPVYSAPPTPQPTLTPQCSLSFSTFFCRLPCHSPVHPHLCGSTQILTLWLLFLDMFLLFSIHYPLYLFSCPCFFFCFVFFFYWKAFVSFIILAWQ